MIFLLAVAIVFGAASLISVAEGWLERRDRRRRIARAHAPKPFDREREDVA